MKYTSIEIRIQFHKIKKKERVISFLQHEGDIHYSLMTGLNHIHITLNVVSLIAIFSDQGSGTILIIQH